MTETKDDSDDNNSRVPDKTDDQRLYGSRYIPYHSNRNSPTVKFCAYLFPAHRCPSAIKFKMRLECASVNFPANKMN